MVAERAQRAANTILYLVVLWAFAARAQSRAFWDLMTVEVIWVKKRAQIDCQIYVSILKLMKMFFWSAGVFFDLHAFSEVSATWALSATVY